MWGNPRGGNKDAKALIYHGGSHSIEIIYVPYPYEVTMKKIIDAGLPESFAAKLSP